MATEVIDIYDENLHVIGQLPRNVAEQRGDWHRSIHCWIVRPDNGGFVLFQKRGRNKKLFPNALDITAAGHYQSGEKPQDGVREILEELGLRIQFSELTPLGIKLDVAKLAGITNREFCDVHLLCRPEQPSDYRLDSSEVEGLVEVAIEDGLRLFSGERENAIANGVEWVGETNTWQPIQMKVTGTSFIPRVDPYYLKVFIMARALLKGERYLSI